MVLAVLEVSFNVDHRERCERSLVHNVAETTVTRRNEFVWNHTTLNLVHETVNLVITLFAISSEWLDVTSNFSELTRTTRLLLVGVFKFRLAADCLAVVNLWSTDFN